MLVMDMAKDISLEVAEENYKNYNIATEVHDGENINCFVESNITEV